MTKEELEEENAKLKCECRRCVHIDCTCILSNYGKDRNGICDHFKDIFDENVELKEKVSYLEDNLRVARKDRKNLQLEVGKGLKEFIKDCFYSALKLYANGYHVEQLTKATELLRFWVNDFYDGFNNLNRYEERYKTLLF